MACASMRRVPCKHVWMDVCLQAVYEASERTMQCSAVCMCLLKFAECLQRGSNIHTHENQQHRFSLENMISFLTY